MNLTFSERGLSVLKRLETLRLASYKPTPADKWTIGYGHTGPDVTENMACTEQDANRWLNADIQWAVDAVNKAVTFRITQGQFDALTIFTYNVGAPGLGKSDLLTAVNSGATLTAVPL